MQPPSPCWDLIKDLWSPLPFYCFLLDLLRFLGAPITIGSFYSHCKTKNKLLSVALIDTWTHFSTNQLENRVTLIYSKDHPNSVSFCPYNFIQIASYNTIAAVCLGTQRVLSLPSLVCPVTFESTAFWKTGFPFRFLPTSPSFPLIVPPESAKQAIWNQGFYSLLWKLLWLPRSLFLGS